MAFSCAVLCNAGSMWQHSPVSQGQREALIHSTLLAHTSQDNHATPQGRTPRPFRDQKRAEAAHDGLVGKSRQAGTIQLCSSWAPFYFLSTLVPPSSIYLSRMSSWAPRIIRRPVPLFQVEDPGQQRLQRERQTRKERAKEKGCERVISYRLPPRPGSPSLIRTAQEGSSELGLRSICSRDVKSLAVPALLLHDKRSEQPLDSWPSTQK